MRVILWATLGVVVATEAYTRVYLLKHGASDVMPGGLLFGAALLFAWVSGAGLLDRGADAMRHRPSLFTLTRPRPGRITSAWLIR
jgi:membrane-associated phospholipid phosphatase